MSALDIILVLVPFTLLLLVPFFLLYNIESKKKEWLHFGLLAFQSHTNPHFIKNVLQAVNWFILNNEKELASDYLCDFARLMDDILKFSKKNFVTLAEKLEFLDLYLKLQHLRHKDKFDYAPLHDRRSTPTIKVDENINPEIFLLPPLLIHPYIENAIEHGLKPRKTKGELLVHFQFKNNKLICTISDNGIGMKASLEMQEKSNTNRSKIGMMNTQKRIEIINKLYDMDINVKISDLNPGTNEPGTIVQMEFPMPLWFNPKRGSPPRSPR
jgi:sensor histidine kinase YesM